MVAKTASWSLNPSETETLLTKSGFNTSRRSRILAVVSQWRVCSRTIWDKWRSFGTSRRRWQRWGSRADGLTELVVQLMPGRLKSPPRISKWFEAALNALSSDSYRDIITAKEEEGGL